MGSFGGFLVPFLIWGSGVLVVLKPPFISLGAFY